MPVDMTDAKVLSLAAQVTTINEVLAKQSYDGMAFEGLFRGFNKGDDSSFNWNMGGRLYAVGGGYQSIERDERKLIRINGEATAEVDISASHVTILHCLMKAPLPEGIDPYFIPGLDREPVKRFVTAAIGNGRIPVRWAADAIADYGEELKKSPKQGYTGDLKKDYPFGIIKAKVSEHMPLLKRIGECPYGWADLQYAEANILIDAMISLIDKGIPSLPIHDSLIVPASKSLEAHNVISDSFFRSLRVKPLIRVK
ncbi:hypothetical protein NS277_07915 [Novosphingobium barchaimii]|nr:hypothetical protein NS277_07915 [Novosphingobium barchaimii]